MTNILPKKSLRDLKPYRPAVAENKNEDVIRLSVNEGALGPSPKTQKAIQEWSKQKHLFHRYPDQIDHNLIYEISRLYALLEDNIVLGNGSDDLIQLICNTFLDPGDEGIYTEYGFLVFPQAIKIAGGIPVKAKDANFTVSLENIQKSITNRTKIIFLANPNNPTGTMVGSLSIESFIKNVRSDILIILDSAYAEYVDSDNYSDGAKFVEAFRNVIMLRTFSKLHALASLRLGWAYCPIEIANILKSVRAPFSVNSLASYAGIAALKDREFQKLSVSHNAKYRAWIFNKLKQYQIDFIPSEANFFLLNFKSEEQASDALEYLEKNKIYVRGMQPYNLKTYLRVSIGTEIEMQKFLDCLLSFLGNKS